MASVEIKVNNIEAIKAMYGTALDKGLEMVGMKCENYAAMLAPFDTGRLSGSITHAMGEAHTMCVGTNVEYAAYQELGTSRMSPHPYLRPAAVNHKGEYAAIIRACLENA